MELGARLPAQQQRAGLVCYFVTRLGDSFTGSGVATTGGVRQSSRIAPDILGSLKYISLSWGPAALNTFRCSCIGTSGDARISQPFGPFAMMTEARMSSW